MTLNWVAFYRIRTRTKHQSINIKIICPQTTAEITLMALTFLVALLLRKIYKTIKNELSAGIRARISFHSSRRQSPSEDTRDFSAISTLHNLDLYNSVPSAAARTEWTSCVLKAPGGRQTKTRSRDEEGREITGLSRNFHYCSALEPLENKICRFFFLLECRHTRL